MIQKLWKNPAVKSMVSIAFYLVVIIGVWVGISTLAFPDAGKSVKTLVEDNEPLLTQLAQAASDDSLIEALTATDTVKDLLTSLNITEIQPTDSGAAFTIRQDSDPAGQATRLLYYSEGGYVFSPDDPDAWTSAESSESATLRWESTEGDSVEVSRLTEHFFLEKTAASD